MSRSYHDILREQRKAIKEVLCEVPQSADELAYVAKVNKHATKCVLADLVFRGEARNEFVKVRHTRPSGVGVWLRQPRFYAVPKGEEHERVSDLG